MRDKDPVKAEHRDLIARLDLCRRLLELSEDQLHEIMADAISKKCSANVVNIISAAIKAKEKAAAV